MSFLSSVELLAIENDFNEVALYETVLLYRFLLFSTAFKIKTTGDIDKVVIVHSEYEHIDTFDMIRFYHHRLSHIAALSPNSSDLEIRKAYIDDVTDALVNIGNECGWDVARIRALKSEIERRNYRFYGAFGAAKSSPDRRHTAQLVWTTDDYINFSVEVKRKKEGSKMQIPVIGITIMLGLFQTICKKFFWIDNNRIHIVQENMRDYWEIDIVQGTSTFHYPRAEKGDAHGQYDFAKMYIDGRYVEQDMEKALMWLEKSAAQGFGRAIRLLERIKRGETNLADPLKSSKRAPQRRNNQNKWQDWGYDDILKIIARKLPSTI